MNIAISGQHIETGSSLQEYVKSKTVDLVNKYFDHAHSVHVHFSKQTHDFTCDVVINDGTGRHTIMKSNAKSHGVYQAYNLALGKVKTQLQKLKTKISRRNKQVKVNSCFPLTI